MNVVRDSGMHAISSAGVSMDEASRPHRYWAMVRAQTLLVLFVTISITRKLSL